MSKNSIPLSLRAAARGVSGIAGLQVTGPWQRIGAAFALPCRITITPPSGSLVSAESDWYAVVEESYPFGAIAVYPAKSGGIALTFQHQSFNGPGNDNEDWRSGKVCLDSVFRLLGRTAFEIEPFDATGPRSRLVWRLRRAVEWVEAAAHDRLTNPGEPFELPDFPLGGEVALTVVNSEDVRSFALWQTLSATYGIAEIVRVAKTKVLLARSFQKLNGEIVFEPSWGPGIASGESITAGWVRLPAVPIVRPWQAPRTWGEMWTALGGREQKPRAELIRTLHRLRDGRRHMLLLGFPIPAVMGGPHTAIHWQPVAIPALSSGILRQRGFRERNDPERHWQNDRRTVLRDEAVVEWQKSENWSADALATRGRLAEGVRQLRTAILGCGTLGSAVGELVTRTGLHRSVLVDDGLLEAGNLCRHSLLLPDIQTPKAIALGNRLTQVNPHVEIVVLKTAFPPKEEAERAELQAVDLVLDCTAEDTVIRALGQFPWGKEVAFVNLWLGLRARRLYCFTARGSPFPVTEFDRLVRPWLVQERNEGGIEDFPREGVGCWHPVFPARLDDVWLLAASAVKYIEHALKTGITDPKLVVFEQEVDGEGFCGVRRLPGEVINGRPRLSIA